MSHKIGPFAFDSDRKRLTLLDGSTTQLGQRAADVLRALVNAGGEVVTKAVLMEAGWPGLAVEEGNLTVQIAGLRRALGTGRRGRTGS